jgi:hypothetical protein
MYDDIGIAITKQLFYLAAVVSRQPNDLGT